MPYSTLRRERFTFAVSLILMLLNAVLLIYGIVYSLTVVTIIAVLLFLVFTYKTMLIAPIVLKKQSFTDFDHIGYTGSFQQTKPKIQVRSTKSEIGVLFIHGFSASTSEFDRLSRELSNRDIPYYVPMITGFGIDSLRLLETISPKDWVRDCIDSYDMLSEVAEKIIVVGHSMGGLLAFHLAMHRKIEKLIITAPYLLEKPKHVFMKKLLLTPFFGDLLVMVHPYVTKSGKKHLDEPTCSEVKRFVYDRVPTNAIRALWVLQTDMIYDSVAGLDVTVLFGGMDNTSDAHRVKAVLKSLTKTNYIVFENSGHNLLEDNERDEVVKTILQRILPE